MCGSARGTLLSLSVRERFFRILNVSWNSLSRWHSKLFLPHSVPLSEGTARPYLSLSLFLNFTGYCMAMTHALINFSLSPHLGVWGVPLGLRGKGMVWPMAGTLWRLFQYYYLPDTVVICCMSPGFTLWWAVCFKIIPT